MKIVICSDNHSNLGVIKKILAQHPDADYYWHLGDSESFNIEKHSPFISVKGNNDYGISLPLKRSIELCGHKFLLTHGTGINNYGIYELVDTAKKGGYDVVVFGHIHRPVDEVVDGIRMINPGSCLHNRNYPHPTYCVMNINDEGIIDIYFHDVDKLYDHLI